ncbi:MAG TPA: Ig-like domain-containing protein [Longimicrobiales bacterium]|nr:Ig-like domain-containing protein [Longimicrobiales bacterium]
MSGLNAYRGRAHARHRPAVRRRRMGLISTLLLLAACDDGQGPDDVVHVVELTPLQAVLVVGDTVEMSAVAKGPGGQPRTDVQLEWQSRQPQVATVLASGGTARVAGLKAGLAEINAGTHGKTGVATVEVRNPLPVVAALAPGSAAAGSQGLTLVVTGTGFAADAQVLWNGAARTTQFVSAQELRAAIPSSDLATAGSYEVGVRNSAPGGGTSGTLPFVVSGGGVAYVDMQPGTASVAVGQTVALAATPRSAAGGVVHTPVTWSSGHTATATVTQQGVVTGVAAGTATIAAATDGGVTGYVVVTVTAPQGPLPTISEITPDSADSSPAGFEITIRGAGFTANTGAFLNSSSRPTEYVSATELRMLLWPGDLGTSGTREVRVFNPGAGMSAGVAFRIVPGVWSVRIEQQDIALWPGQAMQLTATAYDEQNRPVTGRKVTWQSSQASVATVDSTGRVRALSSGFATIEAVISGRSAVRHMEVYHPLPWDLLYEGTHGGYSELWLLTPGPDAAPRRLLPAGTWATDPAASPDGSRIAFVGLNSGGDRNIFIVNRDGTNLRQLTSHAGTDDQPVWSRDGSRIAFRSDRDGFSDVWVVNADGTNPVNVSRNSSRSGAGRVAAERPSWTPAGRVVFSWGFELLNPRPYRLVSVAADGSDWRELTDGSMWRDYEAEVSPLGTLIALRRAHSQYGEFIDVMAGDGTQLGWINWPGQGYTPSWSPDGTWLTYSVSDGPGHSAIVIFPLATMSGGQGGWRVVVPTGGRNPVWIRR